LPHMLGGVYECLDYDNVYCFECPECRKHGDGELIVEVLKTDQ